MPSVPIYIRKDDWPKWDSIKDKPEFIHNALNPVYKATKDYVEETLPNGTKIRVGKLPDGGYGITKTKPRKTSPEEFQTFFKKGKK